jgi:N-acetylglucosaminyldiphosphoundecaprenol N-acetyl-beta-D-mannosaminyltransferase
MISRVSILGVKISAINMSQAIGKIEHWIDADNPQYICVTPAHGVMECQGDFELTEIFNNSGLTTPDGMPIVWLLKFYGHSHVERVYGPDLMLEVCKQGVQRGWRHFFYGGAPGVGEKLTRKLSKRFPGLVVAGVISPPFRELTQEEEVEYKNLIVEASPDILWVGISTPKQEKWMAAQVDQLGVPVLIGVGAAFDFLSGVKKQAPKWIQRSGFEWFFRFLSEPKRLWRRYIQYPRFVLLVFLQLLGINKYE